MRPSAETNERNVGVSRYASREETKTMKHFHFSAKSLIALPLAGALAGLAACSSPQPTPVLQPPPIQQPGQNVTATSNLGGQGLDLQSVVALLKEVKDGEALERKLNAPNSINNLDLNRDGKVDYIRVQEYQGGSTKNFSLTTDFGDGNVQEIADIRVEQPAGQPQAVVQVQGNQALYGPSVYYTARFPVAEALFLLWALAPRPAVYVSPYRWGYYPTYYQPYSPVPYSSYQTTTRTYARTTTVTRVERPAVQSTAVSPNANRAATLTQPTGTQRQFQTRSDSRPIASGGFGQGAATQRATSQPAPTSPATRPAPPPAYAPSAPRPAAAPPPSYPAARPAPAPARPAAPAPAQRNFNTRGRRG
jgi:hypothetical protein